MSTDGTGVRLFPPTFQPWQASNSNRSIAVLISGGVDSSVSAMLLKQAGWDVLGITMKIPLAQRTDHSRPCCGSDVAAVCRQLGIAHYFLHVKEAFEEFVISPFRRAYTQGCTPSPCVDCNTFIKFGAVWDFLRKTFDIRHLATGHYVRIIQQDAKPCLTRAADRARDQSYFLYNIAAERLSELVFPLGEFTKQQVRQLAKDNNLPVADRQDSMELCFAGQGDYRQALGEIPPLPGPIFDSAGKVLGQHQGIFNYTLGQRRGLGVAFTEPLYVIGICPQKNSVTLGTSQQAHRRNVSITGINTFVPDKLQPGQQLLGQIRSPGKASACTVLTAGPEARVEFAEPQFSPCSGQRLVLYDSNDNAVVAGGTISSANKPWI